MEEKREAYVVIISGQVFQQENTTESEMVKHLSEVLSKPKGQRPLIEMRGKLGLTLIDVNVDGVSALVTPLEKFEKLQRQARPGPQIQPAAGLFTPKRH